MSRRPARKKPAGAALPTVVISADEITLRFDATGSVPPVGAALMVDGAVVASTRLADGVGLLPFPGWRFGRVATVVAVPDGRLLAPPIELLGRRTISQVRWGVADGSISGSFVVQGDLFAAGHTAIPVQLVEASNVLHTVFAEQDGAEYRFQSPLPRLAKVDAPLTLSLTVGGLDVGTPLAIGMAECGIAGYIAGYVEQSEQPFVHGWIADIRDPARVVDVEVSVGDQVIWTGPADLVREDIAALGLSDGRSSYHVPLPKGIRRATPLVVTARVAGTATHLANSPYTLPALPPYFGFFDALEGPFAGGWAVNMHDPDVPLRMEAVCDGEVIGSGVAELFRGDVEQAGMPTARCGFRFILERPLPELYGRDIHVRLAGTDIVLGGSPQQINQNSNIVRFLDRRNAIAEPVLQRLVRRLSHEAQGCVISILMPVYNTRREWLLEALNSVLGQWSPHWELICIDDGSTEPHVAEMLAAAARHDRRVRVMRSPGNLGIARAINFGLRAARGDYVAFMDHDDVLEPDAIQKLARAARQTAADLLYTDEAITTDDINSIVEVRARPAFSYDYYLSHPYFVHLVCARTEIARQLAGWDETLSISADVDFVLRMIEKSKVVTHVPGVLYRWRTHGSSTGHSK